MDGLQTLYWFQTLYLNEDVLSGSVDRRWNKESSKMHSDSSFCEDLVKFHTSQGVFFCI